MQRELAMGQGTNSTSAMEQGTRERARKAAEGLTHLSGFGNEHSSEAVPGALPVGRNAPQRAPWACTRSS